jgi:hypothetical protein
VAGDGVDEGHHEWKTNHVVPPTGRHDERKTGTNQRAPASRSVSWRTGNTLLSLAARVGAEPMHRAPKHPPLTYRGSIRLHLGEPAVGGPGRAALAW